MNIFGQVWLWSLLSFVAGVLLTWLVMVRPARKQIADLDDQLLDARRSAPPIAAPAPVDDFVVDEWDAPPRSLSDEVLTPPAPVPALPPAPAPYAEPPAYFGEPVPAPAPAPLPVPPPPVVEDTKQYEHSTYEQVAPYEQDKYEQSTYETATFEAQPEVEEEPASPVRQYLEPEEAQRRFEEQLAEEKARAEAEDDRPRSLFERLGPEDVPAETPAEQTTVLSQSGLEAADFDNEPELPAETTSYVPTVEPVAEPGAPAAQPTAGPEVDEQGDDFIYQPREVWAQDEPETFLDEAAEQEDEPARTRSEQTTFIAVEQGGWPDNDLTGEYPGMRDEISGQLDGFSEPRHEVEPESPAEQTGLIEPIVEPVDLDAPSVRNGVFESTLAEEQSFTEPDAEPEQESAHALREEPEPEQADEPEQVFEPEQAYEPEQVFDEFVEPEATYSQSLFSQPFSTPGAPPPAPFSAFEPRVETDEVPERTPRAVGAAFSHGTEVPAAAPPAPVAEHRRSLFEPLLDADEPLPALGQTRTLPDTSNDQPFVPKFVPSNEPLLAAPPEPEPEPVVEDLPQRHTEAGLPIREARRTTPQRQQSFPAFSAFESPKQEPQPTPAAALPTRPRPVGFSPSTGGRPNGTPAAPSSGARFQQPEGFNPRSPFGPGSVLPKSDGHAPAADFAVKATLTGRRYYSEGSANFGDTRADVWFRTEADAEKAGFRPAP
ncbi:sunset domain-containing protein [Lentzea sp. HUAS TT2]|uniref:sunset domain-containing protein n=1 Tax=Lentzea sp. HUAS TT2 TaxID=3447454 RepID=UPI003F7215A7